MRSSLLIVICDGLAFAITNHLDKPFTHRMPTSARE